MKKYDILKQKSIGDDFVAQFLSEDFLLKSNTAKTLYHNYAKYMPIVDYHCHVSPKEIYKDKHFDNIT